MEHCMHYTDYARNNSNPPDVVATCCNCGQSTEETVFEMQELGRGHGERIDADIQMIPAANENPLGTECNVQ